MTAPRLRVSVIALLGLVACGGGDDGEAAGDSTTTSTSQARTERCVAPTFALEYPPTWHVNDTDRAASCRWFHPSPFEVPAATDAVGLAMSFSYENGTVTTLADAVSEDEILDRRAARIDHRDAVRVHRRTRVDALLPEGTAVLSWFVAAGPRTLVATTSSTATAGTFADNAATLDEMAESLRFSAPFACSAAGIPLEGQGIPKVPAPVASTHQRIVAAALACDISALGELATEGTEAFTFSFGASDDPVSFWNEAERRGDDPLSTLTRLLQLDHAARRVGDSEQFVWPAAHTYDRWQDVPARHQDELRRLYPPDVIDGFAADDAYLGHRVGIKRRRRMDLLRRRRLIDASLGAAPGARTGSPG